MTFTEIGETERILATAITEQLCLGADGALEPLTAGITRPVAQTVTHAGIVAGCGGTPLRCRNSRDSCRNARYPRKVDKPGGMMSKNDKWQQYGQLGPYEKIDTRIAWLEQKMVEVLWLLISVTSSSSEVWPPGSHESFWRRSPCGFLRRCSQSLAW